MKKRVTMTPGGWSVAADPAFAPQPFEDGAEIIREAPCGCVLSPWTHEVWPCHVHWDGVMEHLRTIHQTARATQKG